MTAGLFCFPPLHPRQCERSEAIHATASGKLDCFAALAMTPKGLPSLQKALRIDVDLQLEVALGLRTGGEPFTQVFRQVDIAQRLHQQPEAVAALDHGKRRFGWPQHLDALVDRRYG